MVDLYESLAFPSLRLDRLFRLLPALLARGSDGLCSPAAYPDLQRQHRLSDREITNLRSHRDSGMTIRQLASKYEIHRTTVMNHLKRSKQIDSSE